MNRTLSYRDTSWNPFMKRFWIGNIDACIWLNIGEYWKWKSLNHIWLGSLLHVLEPARHLSRYLLMWTSGKLCDNTYGPLGHQVSNLHRAAPIRVLQLAQQLLWVCWYRLIIIKEFECTTQALRCDFIYWQHFRTVGKRNKSYYIKFFHWLYLALKISIVYEMI